jgi:ATP-dependent helicase HrpB
MFLAAHEFQCIRPVALIAALAQGRSLWIRNPGARVEEARRDLFGEEGDSDFFILMRAWSYAQKCRYDLDRCQRLGIHAQTARQVEPLFEAFLDIAKREGLELSGPPLSNDRVQKCLLLGFADHLAKRCDSGSLRCRLVHRRGGVLFRETVVRDYDLLVAGEVQEIENRDGELQVMLGLNTGIKIEWIHELFPNQFNNDDEVTYDPSRRRVVVLKKKSFRELDLEISHSEKPPLDRAASVLAEQVLKGECPLKTWDDAIEQWITRVNELGNWWPELEIPKIGEEERKLMIEQICLGATSYKEIKEKPVASFVRSILSASQQDLVERYAPDRLELKSGKKAKITYSINGPPLLSARIQDLYGIEGDLSLAEGRVKLTIQVLAPNFRPVQITQDLTIFWKEMYPKLKQELQRKYPKHEWR